MWGYNMGKKKREFVESGITDGMKKHIKYLIGLSIISKILIVFLTTIILGSFIDYYTINYYYEHAMTNFNGSYTYINYYYEYPILIFIPTILALIPSLLLNSVSVFHIGFSILMILCDCITVACIYLISRKVWNDSKTAFIAATLYLTAVSTMYFVMIDYGALPSAVLMLGLTTLLYGNQVIGMIGINEYLSTILGYFLKIYTIVALPFIILYKSKSTSLKQEIISALKIVIPVSLLLFVPLFIFNPQSVFKTYFPMRMDIGYFPNTIIWTLYTWLHDVFNIGITMENTLMFIYTCMFIGICALGYFAFKNKTQDFTTLLKFIFCGIMIIVLSFKVRSPSYIIWFTPFLCILIADNIYKICLFYIFQILAYIEFPLTFWTLWTNISYTNPIYSFNWYMALLLFTFEFSVLLLLVWLAVEPIKLYNKIRS